MFNPLLIEVIMLKLFLNLFFLCEVKSILAFVLNFRKHCISQKARTKLPRPPFPKKQPQAKLASTFIKNFPAFNSPLFNQVLIKSFVLCISTFACLKINQYSTGLFVSYSRINPIVRNYFHWTKNASVSNFEISKLKA